jgi:RNA-directed DNA polymerase
MSDKRLNNQLTLAFPTEERGEALRAVEGSVESLAANRPVESPGMGEQLMEAVCAWSNIQQAVRRVKRNHGSAGVDGMTVHQLPAYLRQHWPTLRAQLLAGTYVPYPVKRVEIPKSDGGSRRLGIPTVVDRCIQQAVLQVLQGDWDRTFSAYSYGFRPGRSAHQAVEQAQRYLADGYYWVVDLDLEKFFDRVCHDKLMARLAQRIRDTRVLKLVRAFLRAGVFANGLVSPLAAGTPQGGPLSPLLSNIVLDELDREVEQRGLRFVRYADDCQIYVRSRRAGLRVLASLTRFLTRRLKLHVNQQKSAVGLGATRTFLGFGFTAAREPKRRIAPEALRRCKRRIRGVTRRMRGVSIGRMARDLTLYLRGWLGYFGKCQTPSVLHRLEEWMRRRLRSAIWTQWKRGRVRFAALRKRGVGLALAARTARSAHGPWRLAQSPALTIALPKAYFDSLGIPRLTVCR